MALPERTAPQLAAIAAMSGKLLDFWTAADAILQFDGAFVGDAAAARSALDTARTALIDAIASPLFAPTSNKGAILARIAVCTELAVASLEGSDLQQVTGLETTSRDVARLSDAECHGLVAAAVCGRLTL